MHNQFTSKSSFRSDCQFNTSWKKGVGGADEKNGEYPRNTRVTGYKSNGNYRIEDNCVIDLDSRL